MRVPCPVQGTKLCHPSARIVRRFVRVCHNAAVTILPAAAMEGRLLPLDLPSPGETWQTAVAAAAELSNDRLYVLLRGVQSESAATQPMLEVLEQLFAVLATAEKPTLDLVPLLSSAGWSLERIATLPDLRTVLSAPAPDIEAAVSLAEELNAFRELGRPPLPPLRVACIPAPREAQQQHGQDGGAASSLADGAEPLCWAHVAVGGTFDRLHAGHRILLAATALVTASTGCVYIGVTGEALLKNKMYASLLQPYEERCGAAAAYVKEVHPDVAVQTGELHDPMGMAADIEEMEAIVVSEETRAGADAINTERRIRGYTPLAVVIVKLVGGDDAASKLSSTALRQAETERQDSA